MRHLGATPRRGSWGLRRADARALGIRALTAQLSIGGRSVPGRSSLQAVSGPSRGSDPSQYVRSLTWGDAAAIPKERRALLGWQWGPARPTTRAMHAASPAGPEGPEIPSVGGAQAAPGPF
eukprot:scaffold1007_cov364-Prasinococcus_capsulatus_cf.AAC.13